MGLQKCIVSQNPKSCSSSSSVTSGQWGHTQTEPRKEEGSGQILKWNIAGLQPDFSGFLHFLTPFFIWIMQAEVFVAETQPYKKLFDIHSPPQKKLFIWLFCQHFGLKIKCLIAQRFNMTQQNVTLYLRIFSYLSVLMISETIRLCKLLKWPHQGALPPDVKQNTCPIQAGQCEQNCLVKPNTSTAKISIAEQCFSNSWNVQKFSLYLMLVLLSFYLKFSATSLLHSETVAVDKNTSSMVLGWQRWAI